MTYVKGQHLMVILVKNKHIHKNIYMKKEHKQSMIKQWGNRQLAVYHETGMVYEYALR